MNTTILIALLNGLWQGIALVAITMLALRCWRGRNAATTCAIWSAVYVAVALLPLADVVIQYRVTAQSLPTVTRAFVFRPDAGDAPVRTAATDRANSAAAVGVTETQRRFELAAAPPSLLSRIDAAGRVVGERASGIASTAAMPLFALWAIVALALLARLMRGYALVLGLKRAATPLADRGLTARIAAASPHRQLAIATSEHISVPCAVGFLHPMILLPAPLTDSLERDDLARILLHELAHLQRHDDWLNAVQRAIGAVFFFQPALAYVSRQIDLTREIACDDRVLETTGEPIRYAQCLTKMVEHRVHGRVAAVPGFVFGTAQVVARVRTIVERRGAFSSRITRSAGAAALGVAFVAFAIARIQVPVVAQAVSEPTMILASTPMRAVRGWLGIQTFAIDDKPLVLPVVKTAKTLSPAQTAKLPKVKVLVLPRVVADLPTPKMSATSIVTRLSNNIELPTDANTQVAPLPSVRVIRPTVSVRVSTDDDMPTPPPAASLPSVPPTVGSYRLTPPLTVHIALPRRVDILDALEAGGYGHPGVDQLIALRNAGVDGAYIKAMSLGNGRPTLTELIDLRNKGVRPKSDLIELRSATPAAYLERLRDWGFGSISPPDLARVSATLRNAGITPEKLRQITVTTTSPTTIDQLLEALKSMGDQPK